MNEKDILRALGGVSPEFIADAAPKEKLRHRNPMLFRLVAALISVAILMGALFAAIIVPKIVNETFVPTPSPYGRYVLSLAKYPEMMQMPKREDYASDDAYYDAKYDWRRATAKQSGSGLNGESVAQLYPFFSEFTSEALKTEKDENLVVSPLTMYMLLSMLAEMTDGETREQIFDVLNVSTIEELRTLASGVWNSTYCDNGGFKSVLANSVWLDESIRFNRNVAHTLSEIYYASSFEGDFSKEKYVSEYCNWMNENTGNLFGISPENASVNVQTLMSIVSTLYFESAWRDDSSFNPNNNYNDVFHTNSGDVEATYMKRKLERNLFGSEYFYATYLELGSDGEMWIFLPDEEDSVEDVLSSEDFMNLVTKGNGVECKEYEITLSLPKFDIASHDSAEKYLERLGITDIFGSNADFSPVTDSNVAVGEILQGTRLKIDEEGVVGGAYNEAIVWMGQHFPPDKKFEFVLNRPFVVAITTRANLPLFIGVVNDPTKN